MKRVLLATAVVGFAGFLGACGNGSGDGAGDAGGGTTDGGTDTGTGAGTGGHTDSGGAGGGGGGTGGTDSGGGSVADATQATPDGTMTLFIAAIRAVDFEMASTFCDPTSVGFARITELGTAFTKAKENPDGAKLAIPILKAAFTSSYQTASFEMLSVESPRAMARLSLKNLEAMDVSLQEVDGKWYILAPENLVPVVTTALPDIPADVVPTVPSIPSGLPVPGGTDTSSGSGGL